MNSIHLGECGKENEAHSIFSGMQCKLQFAAVNEKI